MIRVTSGARTGVDLIELEDGSRALRAWHDNRWKIAAPGEDARPATKAEAAQLELVFRGALRPTGNRFPCPAVPGFIRAAGVGARPDGRRRGVEP